MKVYVGVDLGSTTTKAVILDEEGRLLGRGITNSRSNYDTAVGVARTEAYTAARFTLLSRALEEDGLGSTADVDDFLTRLDRAFRLEQYLDDLGRLERTCLEEARAREAGASVETALGALFEGMREEAPTLFAPGTERRSDFFRDVASAAFMDRVGAAAAGAGTDDDRLIALYDRCIIPVENETGAEPGPLLLAAMDRVLAEAAALRPVRQILSDRLSAVLALDLEEDGNVGTGYGRARLPFPREQIRSEILCHGLGAHVMYPGTRTVLDIGGQDTKAIQVDDEGIVEGFQMNDRCAAGCGRYLGYIADEMQLGLHQLGPLAMQADRCPRINSTCTVFAGAELRDRLALGEKREDVLSGLHRAIILRALSLLSRSGGVRNELTFTGGVAKNEAAVAALRDLVEDSYGPTTLNVNPDSIYTGALGAATFARRTARGEA
jgi:benzoyl-CoA reductase subunit A